MSPRAHAALLAAALGAVLPAAAAGPGITLTVDSRIELLGVVQYLAGHHRPVPGEDLSAVEARFARFRSHPAVAAYRKTVARAGDSEPYGLIALLLTDVPDLRWRRAPSLLSNDFLEKAGGLQAVEDFLKDLRGFAAASDFQGYLDSGKPSRRRFEAAAAAELGDRDVLGRIEGYVGLKLHSRMNFVLCSLYSPSLTDTYIVPYPGGKPAPKGPFDVYKLLAPLSLDGEGRPAFVIGNPEAGGIWMETLYLAVEPASARYEKQLLESSSLHAAFGTGCFATWTHCANHLIAMALSERVSEAMFGRAPAAQREHAPALEQALAARLEEYEGHRERYPTLVDFYPRLLDVFQTAAARPGVR